MTAPALLLLVVLVQFAPEHLADALHQSAAAWGYVAGGVQAAALWLIVLVLVPDWTARAVAAYGAVESALQPACRLAFDMAVPPPRPLPGQNLCDIAAGQDLSWLSIAAACGVAVYVRRAQHQPHRKGRTS